MISVKFLALSPPIGRFLAAISLLALLAGCVSAPPRSAPPADAGAQAIREAALLAQPDWSFRGRVAMAQDGNGGSAGIAWRQHGADYEIALQAPITRQSWRLQSRGGRVVLEGLEGGRREGEDAEALLLAATGWRIPVAAMSAWARGARGPGQSELGTDPEGRPSVLVQAGWTIEYRGWFDGSPPLPRKLYAHQGGASVRLAIEAWESP